MTLSHPQSGSNVSKDIAPSRACETSARSGNATRRIVASMPSLRYLFRTGVGPSSSHTMGPVNAAGIYLSRHHELSRVVCTLYGSLSSTGRGHFTDEAVIERFRSGGVECSVVFSTEALPFHPNGMTLVGFDSAGNTLAPYTCYSVGGGAIITEPSDTDPDGCGEQSTNWDAELFPTYPHTHMDDIIAACEKRQITLADYVYECEANLDAEMLKRSPESYIPFRDFLQAAYRTMSHAVDAGLSRGGVLPGTMNYKRRARSMMDKAAELTDASRHRLLPMIYAIAVGEENADKGTIVTAPTCGACGVLPGVLRYFADTMPQKYESGRVVDALAVAGIVGNIAKANASISGAELGCQAEIGVATAMASGAAAYILGGSNRQVEAAAASGLEHNLGLSCDPVEGYVIVPCVGRNGDNALRAVAKGYESLLVEGSYMSYDEVVETMRITGADMLDDYKETSTGGLAVVYRRRGMDEEEARSAPALSEEK